MRLLVHLFLAVQPPDSVMMPKESPLHTHLLPPPALPSTSSPSPAPSPPSTSSTLRQFFPSRQPSHDEISSPSPYDLPDSFYHFKCLPYLFHKKKLLIILNGIGTFLALVLYQHAIYDILWINYSNPNFYLYYHFFLLFGSIFALVLSRSLESIVQYDPMNLEDSVTLSMINETTYLCGYIDRDLVTCCGIPCTLHCCYGYKIYILRIIRYNINAILISACWVGSDTCFGILTERVMSRRDAPRLGLDIFLLILSNLLLLYCGQLSGQMGVFSDDHVVESISISQTATILENSITQINQNTKSFISESTTSNSETYTPPSIIPLSTSQPTQQEEQRNEELSFDERFTERESSLIERSKMEISLHFKVTLTLIGVLIYWFAIWDLCWNYPREALIKTVYESRDDDVGPVDSYSRRHVSPKVEIYLMLIGILYCIASTLVLIVTGGLYTMVNNDTEETQAVGSPIFSSAVSAH